MGVIRGADAYIFIDGFDISNVISTGSTTADTWYFILKKGDSSALPFGVGYFFKSPKTGAQKTLVSGDQILPLTQNRICKSSADISFEQGSIDVGTDCNPGASILDGVIKTSGSISGFFDENEQTGEFTDITEDILTHFTKIAEDDGKGNYTLSDDISDPRMFMLVNIGSKNAEYEKWLLLPIIFPSLASSIGLTNAMNMDLSWVQGEGQTMLYKRIRNPTP